MPSGPAVSFVRTPFSMADLSDRLKAVLAS